MLCVYNLSPNQCLLIHQPWHFDLVPAVVRHFEIAQKRGIGDGSLSESAAEILGLIAAIYKEAGKQDIRELCPSLSISSIEGVLRKPLASGELKREGSGKNICYYRVS